jgi:hypothetical protein
LSQVKQQRGKGKKGLETLTRSGYARLTYRPPSPRKSDDVGVSVWLGLNHPVEGECNKIISEGLIVSQFSQTSAFACIVGVVVGGHGVSGTRLGLRVRKVATDAGVWCPVSTGDIWCLVLWSDYSSRETCARSNSAAPFSQRSARVVSSSLFGFGTRVVCEGCLANLATPTGASAGC